jgi:uncharacterized protein (UPF0332 family)
MTLIQTVTYYLNEARVTLVTARKNFENGAFRTAVHEAYYAMFYAATAALGTRELNYKRHAAVIANFNRVFIHELALFDKALHADFEATFQARLNFDYQPQAASQDDATRPLAAAERFVAGVAPYVEEWLKAARDKEP